jgi:hypothetical protein
MVFFTRPIFFCGDPLGIPGLFFVLKFFGSRNKKTQDEKQEKHKEKKENVSS